MNTQKSIFGITLLLVTVFLFTLGAEEIVAQGGATNDQVGRLQRELERTDELLMRALELVEQSNAPTALLALNRASQLQRNARESFQAQRYLISLSQTNRAREQAKLSLSLAQQVEQFEGAVVRRLERASELLEAARERIQLTDNRQLQAMYDAAHDNLERAWQFYRQRRYKPALKLAKQIEDAARKLAIAAGISSQADANYERRRDNVQEFLANTDDLVRDCGSPVAKGLMTQARQAFELAEQLQESAQTVKGLEALKRSRELAMQAARTCQGQDRLERRYERLAAEIERKAEEVGSTGMLPQLLDQARKQIRLAREHLDNGDDEAAAAALRAASLTLKRMDELSTGSR